MASGRTGHVLQSLLIPSTGSTLVPPLPLRSNIDLLRIRTLHSTTRGFFTTFNIIPKHLFRIRLSIPLYRDINELTFLQFTHSLVFIYFLKHSETKSSRSEAIKATKRIPHPQRSPETGCVGYRQSGSFSGLVATTEASVPLALVPTSCRYF